MCSNIPAKPTYGVYVSQLIRISRICDNYVSFVKRHRLLTERLIKQGFWYNKISTYVYHLRSLVEDTQCYLISMQLVLRGI